MRKKVTINEAKSICDKFGLSTPEQRSDVGMAWPPKLADAVRLQVSVDQMPPPPGDIISQT